MKANELRIGNIINKRGIGLIKVHSQVMQNLVFSSQEKFDKYYDMYQPVLLTEEILLKCKHIKPQTFHCAEGSIKGWCIEQDNSALDIVLFKDRFHLYKRTDDVYWGYIENAIFNLHDLQNIFYYNDNQKRELEINL